MVMKRNMGKERKFFLNNKRIESIVVTALVFFVCSLLVFSVHKPSMFLVPNIIEASFSPPYAHNDLLEEQNNEWTVNVKQFGAFGDGLHDDTKAIQSAIDFANSKVIFPRGRYKSGQINITKNLIIDCQNSSFVATEKKLFNVCGKITKILEGQASYSANQTGYTLSDGYSGFGKILGKNNFCPTRTYYRGGMVAWFNNGVMSDTIPVDATTPTVTEIMPVSCEIKNIDGVKFANTTDGMAVFIQYGVKCLVKNIKINTGVFSIVYLKDCNACEISDIVANLPEYKGNKKNIYPICIVTSSYTHVHDCIIDNPFWHCLSGGGAEGICLNILIQNCTFTSKTQYSICDHGNCIGTRVENCKCSGIGVAGNSRVRDCVIVPLNNPKKRCELLLFPTSMKDLANYDVENVLFLPSKDSEICGLYFAGYSQTLDNVVYVNNARLKNVKLNSESANEKGRLGFRFNAVKFKTVNLGNITVEDCNLQGFLSDYNRINFDTSNYSITYKNCKTMRSKGNPIQIAMPTGGTVSINDSNVDTIIESGTPQNLNLDNVVFYNIANIKATDYVYGKNIWAQQGLELQDTNKVLLDNVRIGSQRYDKIWRMDSSQDCYGKRPGDDFEEIIETRLEVD